MTKKTDYTALCAMLKTLTDGTVHRIAHLANASALLYESLDRLNWAGFYLMEDGLLVLGPFQGKPACIEIRPGHGVCGTAVVRNQTVVVANVHEFSGHIVCDGASNSEIVVPIRQNGNVIGVLDLDSPDYDRFTDEDQIGLEAFVSILEKTI